ncbi:MAG: HDIG domain-containing protein [bacterium]|nr:HDIG domain-containing protein [bacterium]MDE0288287.1 HDIG domain-containing protein [bacterium]MDE0437311.1 HDIG domain-containing protein [bacterium]
MSPKVRFLIRGVFLLATVALSWGALLIGQQSVEVTVGEPSPETFIAETPFRIEDVEATEEKRQEARAAVDSEYKTDDAIDALVVENILGFFASVRTATADQRAAPLPVVTTSSTIPPPTTSAPTTTLPATTTSIAAEATTTVPGFVEGQEPAETTTTPPTTVPPTTVPEVPRTSGVTGQVLIGTGGDGVLVPRDQGLGDIRLVAYDSTGAQFVDRTLNSGRFSFTGMAAGPATILVDTESVPQRLTAHEDLLLREVVLVSERELELEALRMEPVVVSQDIQVANLRGAGYSLSDTTIQLLVRIATGDVVREILGQAPWLPSIEQDVVRLATETLDAGILSEDLLGVKRDIRSRTILIPIPDVDSAAWEAVSPVVYEVAAEFLAANKSLDDVAMATSRDEAAEQVEAEQIEYPAGTIIVEQGEEITEQIERALEAGALLGLKTPHRVALALAALFIVGLIMLYVYRFQASVWASMRRIALLGLLITLSALAARGVAVFVDTNPAIGYLVPAAAFGLMTAILFDARTAVLMAVAVGSMTAVATTDPGYTLFAVLSTLAPVPFVSSISARRDLRRAALYIVVISAALASVIAWFFHENLPIYEAAAFALGNGAISWLIGSSLLSVLEIMFDITTSLRLLDLTDRNHPALRLLEQKAIGSFNHSLMVGTLADRAARAVDANPLLARAAAYYHDLGKTENPQFFIENQFGIQNPHDQMAPERSADVIRRHVLDGITLARKFRIPGEVAESVITHHGDGIMHFFYNRAKERYGPDAVDMEDYRHAGRKPVRKEMAIVMMADSVEGACRAVFQNEEPSPERIEQLVERVVSEKVSDGQLSASHLTLGDLTSAKAAMVDALVGHYHQRIPYPNFPDAE